MTVDMGLFNAKVAYSAAPDAYEHIPSYVRAAAAEAFDVREEFAAARRAREAATAAITQGE